MKNVCKQIGFIAITALSIAVLSLTGCSKVNNARLAISAIQEMLGNSDQTSGSGGGTRGWPPNSVLSQWGLSGMSAPTGATNSGWARVPNTGLQINFNGNSATDAAVDQWLTRNGWSLYVEIPGHKTYMKTSYMVVYNFDSNPRSVAVINDDLTTATGGGTTASESGGGFLSGIVGWFRGLGKGGGLGRGGKPAPLAANATLKQARDKLDAIIAYCDAHKTKNNESLSSGAGMLSTNLWGLSLLPDGTFYWNQQKDELIEMINTVIVDLE